MIMFEGEVASQFPPMVSTEYTGFSKISENFWNSKVILIWCFWDARHAKDFFEAQSTNPFRYGNCIIKKAVNYLNFKNNNYNYYDA